MIGTERGSGAALYKELNVVVLWSILGTEKGSGPVLQRIATKSNLYQELNVVVL